MSAVEEVRRQCQSDVQWLALPGAPGEAIKSCIRRVAMKTSLDFGIVKRMWYGEYRRIPTDVSDAVRKAVKEHEHRQDAEWAIIKQRYWVLSHQSSDPEFYSVRAHEAGAANDGLD